MIHHVAVQVFLAYVHNFEVILQNIRKISAWRGGGKIYTSVIFFTCYIQIGTNKNWDKLL
jgi:hypothetical protein